MCIQERNSIQAIEEEREWEGGKGGGGGGGWGCTACPRGKECERGDVEKS